MERRCCFNDPSSKTNGRAEGDVGDPGGPCILGSALSSCGAEVGGTDDNGFNGESRLSILGCDVRLALLGESDEEPVPVPGFGVELLFSMCDVTKGVCGILERTNVSI